MTSDEFFDFLGTHTFEQIVVFIVAVVAIVIFFYWLLNHVPGKYQDKLNQ